MMNDLTYLSPLMIYFSDLDLTFAESMEIMNNAFFYKNHLN